ncbi:MAG: RES family NAD+ phosphorylase [Verrucomicrobiae bacterium]
MRSQKRLAFGLLGTAKAAGGGRWNPPDFPMVYLSESLAMATLEKLVHLPMPEGLAARFVRFHVVFSAAMVETFPVSELPADWDDKPVPASTQRLGATWLQELRSGVIAVPSAIIPSERNFLVNPRHPDFKKLRIGKPDVFPFDSRLLRAHA